MPNLSSDVFRTRALDNILQVYTKTVQTVLEQLHIYGKTVVCWCLIFQSFLYIYISIQPVIFIKLLKLQRQFIS